MHITLSNLNDRTCLLTKGPEGALALWPLCPGFFNPDLVSSSWNNQSNGVVSLSPSLIPKDFRLISYFQL